MAIVVQPAMEVAAKNKPPTKQGRVVVTGIGVQTPIGHDPDVFYNNLLQGKIAGETKTFLTDGWVAPKLSKRMDIFMLYMLTASKNALADSRITDKVMNELDKTRYGVLIGSAIGWMKELLAFLLDGLYEDLNQVKQKPYIKTKDSDGRHDDEVTEEFWSNC